MNAQSRSAHAHGGLARENTTLVGLLTWTYQRQKADAMSGRGLAGQDKAGAAKTRQHWSGCGCAQLGAIAELGARIAPGGWQRPVLHPDAELVHELVIELSRTNWPGAILLRQHGYRGDTPDWGDGKQQFEPVYDAQDGIVQDRFDEMVAAPDRSGRIRMVPVRYCPLALYPSHEWIAMTRAEYGTWFVALEWLAGTLKQCDLVRWQIGGLGALPEPWRGIDRTKHENKP